MYHTDWVADRTIAWLDSLDPDDDWFCWMSFPDPHHPWDPPVDEVRRRIDWRELDLPPGHPGSTDKAVEILAQQAAPLARLVRGALPEHGRRAHAFVPGNMSHDQVREVNALIHVENELIDEALGRVMARIDERGWGADTDVVFTTDHGELQGDFGLLFKGPYHVDALMRVPLVWRPAPSAGVSPAEVHEPVGHVDLAPTFCEIAGAAVPDWAQGRALPDGTGVGPAVGHHRMGQPVPPHRHAPALDLPRRVARAPPTSPVRSTRGPRVSSTTSATTPCSGATSGTTPPTGPGATSSSPTSTTTCPRSEPTSWPSKPPSDAAAAGQGR